MVISVRSARREEIPWIRQVNNDAVPAVNLLSEGDMDQLFQLAARVSIAELDDQPVGFLLALDAASQYHSINYRWFQQRYDEFVYIDRVVIARGFRRLGVGRVLYADIHSYTELTAPLLTCEVNLSPPNPGSVRFHAAYGFQEVGQQDTEGGSKTVSLLAMPIPPFKPAFKLP